jgi:archaemetzincin
MIPRLLLLLLLAFSRLMAAEEEKQAPIALQPLGGVKAERIDVVKRGLEQAFGVTVILLESRPLPKSAWYAPRGRYRADNLLEHLKEIVPAKHPVVIGITEKDISTTKDEHVDWGIFGLGELDGRSCVVSTFRLGTKSVTSPACRTARSPAA